MKIASETMLFQSKLTLALDCGVASDVAFPADPPLMRDMNDGLHVGSTPTSIHHQSLYRQSLITLQ